ncbi:MAG: DEAD/DEAH box helicase [Micrococcales bacterium]|nr:DEAD/DEAH box helicase [Micrococcales bacterium]
MPDLSTACDTAAPFADLGLPDALVAATVRLGFTTPTPIQAAAVPRLLAGHDLVGVAGTGTGKTAAFGLPLLAAVDPDLDAVQGLVLAPTRELALQVADALASFAAQIADVQVVAVYGGAPYLPQKRALAAGAQVVVGTPGRVIDHLERGTLRLDQVRYLVLDEADEMLAMGFAEDVDRVLAAASDDRQTALFSATMPPAIQAVANAHLTAPVQVDVGGKVGTTTEVTHQYATVPHRAKAAALRRVLAMTDAAATIVFVRTREAAEQVGSELVEHGLAAAYLSGDVAQTERERIVARLRDGALDVVVATDVAARGLDVNRVGLVVNLDLPGEPETYVHRTGRTGRAGRTGEALTFVTPAELGRLRRIERALRLTLVATTVPTAQQVAAARTARLLGRAFARDDGRALSSYRDAVATALADQPEDTDLLDLLARVAAVATQGTAADAAAEAELDITLATARRKADRGPDQRRRDDRYEDQPDRPGRHRSGRPRLPSADRTVYRVSVGHRDGIGPGALVGALTGEGGLVGDQIGKIHMFSGFSLIDIPGGLPDEAAERVSRTRVAGRRLNLRPDTGPHGDRQRTDRPRTDRPRRPGPPRRTRPR